MISLAMRARPISLELLSPLYPNATLTENMDASFERKVGTKGDTSSTAQRMLSENTARIGGRRQSR
jgi:hypothetical protein